MAQRFVLVFFDAIDTLLRVRGSVGVVYAPVAARHGHEAEPAAIDAAFRHAIRSMPTACFPDAAAADLPRLEREWWHEVVARTFAPHESFPAFEAFFAEVFELFRTAAPWELLPGAREMLAALARDGRRLGIVSDMDGRLFDVLAAFELGGIFDPIALATRAGVTKRDGALFKYALAMAALPAAQVAHVGDNLHSDIEATRTAGITPIHFDPSATGAPRRVPTVTSLHDVRARLQQLEQS